MSIDDPRREAAPSGSHLSATLMDSMPSRKEGFKIFICLGDGDGRCCQGWDRGSAGPASAPQDHNHVLGALRKINRAPVSLFLPNNGVLGPGCDPQAAEAQRDGDTRLSRSSRDSSKRAAKEPGPGARDSGRGRGSSGSRRMRKRAGRCRCRFLYPLPQKWGDAVTPDAAPKLDSFPPELVGEVGNKTHKDGAEKVLSSAAATCPLPLSTAMTFPLFAWTPSNASAVLAYPKHRTERLNSPSLARMN